MKTSLFTVIFFYVVGLINAIEWLLILFDYYHPKPETVAETSFAAITIATFGLGNFYFREWERRRRDDNKRQNYM